MEKRALFARGLGLTAITNVFVTLSGVILLPVLTKALSVANYGSWSLILVTTALVPVVVSLGLQFSMIRFLGPMKDKYEIKELFYSLGFVILVGSSIASGLFYLFANQIAASFFNGDLAVALILPLNIFFACLNAFLLTYFKAFQQIKTYSSITLLQSYLTVALVAFFVFSGYGLRGAVLGLLIQQLLIFVVSACLILRAIGVARPKLVNIKMYIGFGLPLVLADVSSWTVNSSDRYLVGIFLGTVAVGYYSPAYSLGAAIAIFSYPFVVMLMPSLSRHYEENNLDEVRTMMKYSLKYYSGIAIPSFFALSILSRPLLVVLSTQEIATNGYLVTPFVAAATLLVGAYEVVVQAIALKKKTARLGSIWVISAAVNFGLNLVLIPYLGIIGAAVTTLLAFACAFGLTTFYSLRYFKFDVNGSFILKSVGASIVISVILLVWNPTGLVNILLSIGFCAVIYLAIVFILKGLTLDEIKFFYSAFGNLDRDRLR
jgi:O-antigen/teichoic acid export membrane protein